MRESIVKQGNGKGQGARRRSAKREKRKEKREKRKEKRLNTEDTEAQRAQR